MKEKKISFIVNKREVHITVQVHKTLLDVLREDLYLTGTKEGCDEGECGACTVLMNGRPIHSCCTLATEADGSEILTVEGLEENGELHPLQQAFVDVGAVQCGFCTPGMLMSAKSCLDEFSDPTEEQVRTSIEGNICRCTGYDRIVKAILKAAEDMKAASK